MICILYGSQLINWTVDTYTYHDRPINYYSFL